VSKATKRSANQKAIKDMKPKSGQVKGGKLMSETLSNVQKTRSEISMTFARNARA
jgi:hypothetical protein